jgi:hypothetical protein
MQYAKHKSEWQTNEFMYLFSSTHTLEMTTATDTSLTVSNRHDFQSSTHLILVVARRGHLSANIKRYALEVAQRTGHDLLLAYVNTLPQLFTRNGRGKEMHKAAAKDFCALSAAAAKLDIKTAFVFESGKIGRVTTRLCHLRKKIDFVIIDEDIQMVDVVNHCPVPVFRGKGSTVESSRPLKNIARKPLPRSHHDMTPFLAMQQVLRFLSATAVTCFTYAVLFSYNEQLDALTSSGGAVGLLPAILVLGLFFSQSFMLSSSASLLGIFFNTSKRINTVIVTSKPGKTVSPVNQQRSSVPVYPGGNNI